MRPLVLRATFAALALLLLLPALASAHPLGNFTINHYARITLSQGSITVRWVLDMAEIPTFGEIRDMDANGDEIPGPGEQEAWLQQTLPKLVDTLELTVDGRAVPLQLVDHALSFPAGQGGLSTLRLQLDLHAAAPGKGASVAFTDGTYADRIGWREIVVVVGGGVRLTASDVPTRDVSDELRAYPPDAVNNPLHVSSADFSFRADASAGPTDSQPAANESTTRPDDPLAALVSMDLTPLTGLVAVLLAIGLGAIHGISPGHGKTLVAGYLIGSRGTMRQALWLGITVAISHTAGVMVLGAVTLAATALILPERIIQWLTLGSALLVIGLGVSLARSQSSGRRHAHAHAHEHPHPHGRAGTHAHDHAPAGDVTLSTRGLAALGLVGGMVPSASALLVLLVAVSMQRLVFGIVLVGAFGLGMALVMAGISASVVLLRGRAQSGAGWLQRPTVARVGAALPMASALVVVAIGLVLTVGAAASLAA